MQFKPVKQSRISGEVVEQLKHSIISGNFKAGDKLPSERELAEEFHVSRLAIREAIRTLENSGFIVTRSGANGGAFVTELTFDYLINAFLDLFSTNNISIPELHHVRLIIEPEVARLAALNITPEYAKQLKEAMEIEELPIISLSLDVDRKQRVHFILAQMCGNRFLEALMRSLLKLTKRVVEAVNPDVDTVHPRGMHGAVVEAVVTGNAEAAYEAMKKHTLAFGEYFIKMEKTYRERNSLTPF